MKQLRDIVIVMVLALSAMNAQAQTTMEAVPASAEDSCEWWREYYNAQYWFCDCHYHSIPFAFPLDEVISDTVWYKATFDDLRQGVTAFWFSDVAVTLEVYPLCVSTSPAISLTIGPNQMHEMDVTEINAQLDQIGNVDYLKVLSPAIRVYPHDGGSGHVYCYPYGYGPEAKCADSLILQPSMTYVCSAPENVYRLKYDKIASSGKAIVHWQQDDNACADIWFTRGACEGNEVARHTLSDSLHVWSLDPAMLLDAREAKQDLWLHVKHENGKTGRLRYYNNPKYTDPATPITMKTCQGKTLSANGQTFSADTAFTDTLWVARDTLQTVDISLTFTAPELEYDTVWISAIELSRGYRYTASGTIFYEYGDSIVEIKKKNTCTRLVQVTLLNPEGVESITDGRRKAYKMIENGQLFIIVDERKYNVFGQQYN